MCQFREQRTRPGFKRLTIDKSDKEVVTKQVRCTSAVLQPRAQTRLRDEGTYISLYSTKSLGIVGTTK